MVKYSVVRLALFVAAMGVLALLGAGLELALLGGVVISALLSYVLMKRMRDAATIAIVDRVQARTERRRAARVDEESILDEGLVV